MWCYPKSSRRDDNEKVYVPPSVSEHLTKLRRWNLRIVLQDLVEKDVFSTTTSRLAAAEYRRFLALHVGHPNVSIPVGGTVDTLWHAHILFTEDYTMMCRAVFNTYVHHRPAILDRGSKITVVQRRAAESLYRMEFKKDMPLDLWQ